MIHIAVQGDSIPSIAFEAGLFPETIWEHPENQQLRELRTDLNVLFPGDAVFVPEKRRRAENAATGKSHKFRRRGVPSRLRIQLFQVETPRKNQPFTLIVDGETKAGSTDAKGILEVWVPPQAKTGELRIGGDCILLQFGHLDPVTEVFGLQKRLTNIGYPCGEITGEMNDATREALRSFQRRFDLEITGEFDSATKNSLRTFHDRNDLFPTDPWLAG